MKNSLFKRAFAVAAAAPLALTQCLTVANAASVDNAALAVVANDAATESSNSITLEGENGLTYITPGAGVDDSDDYMVGEDKLADVYETLGDGKFTVTKDSDWNSLVYTKLIGVDKKSGSFSIQSALSEAAKRAGNYQDITNKIIKHVGDVNYVIDDKGNITLTCNVTDIVPEFTEGSKKTIGEVLNDLAAKYGVEIATDDTFSDVTIAGQFTVVINAESLKNDTKVSADVTFTSDKLKQYKGTAIADYGLEQLDALEKDANKAIDEAFEATESEKIADCKAEVADALAYYRKQLNRVKTWSDKALAKTTEKKEYGTFAEALTAAKASRFGQRVENRLNKEIPSTASEAAEKELVNNIYDKIVNQISKNSSYSLDITTGQLGAFADALYDITAQLSAGTATFSAKFEDKELEDAKAYILETYGLNVTDGYKTVDVTADYSGVKAGTGSVDVKFKRVLEVETTTTTSTTSTTSTSTETTTTTSETTSTTTDTTTDTTTATETTSSETTTTKVVKTDANYYVTAKTGFYLNIDEKFNKDQIESIYVSIDEVEISYGEAENEKGEKEIVAETVLSKGKGYNITDKVDFGTQTPSSVFKKGEYKFSHDIALYATEDIEVEGKVVAKSGDVLKNVDGSEANVICYVGVKGDGDLNFMADSKDASLVLVWYSKMSTGAKADEEIFSTSNQIATYDENNQKVAREGYDKNLDEFAAFLCDVNNEKAEDNFYIQKPARKIMSNDASFILKLYGKTSTGGNPDRATWDSVLYSSSSTTEE